MLSFNHYSRDGQHIPFISQPPFLGYSRTKLWLSRVYVPLAGKRRGFNHLLWPMDVQEIFLEHSMMLHNQGFMCPLTHMSHMWTSLTHVHHNNLPFYLCLLQFLCSCPAVSPGSDNQSYAFCAVRAFWCSEGSNNDKGQKNAEFSLTHMAFSSRNLTTALFFAEAMQCIFCLLHSVHCHWFKHQVALSHVQR